MSFDAAQISFLEERRESVEVVMTVDFQFRDATLYLSNSVVERTIGGQVYTGLGGVLEASPVERSDGFQAKAVTYKIRAQLGDLALAIDTDKAQYKNRDCIRKIQMYADGVAVGSPVTVHHGFMDAAEWRASHDEEFAEITVRDRFSKRIASPRFYTDTGQRAVYADDDAFQYMASFARGVNLSGWLTPEK